MVKQIPIPLKHTNVPMAFKTFTFGKGLVHLWLLFLLYVCMKQMLYKLHCFMHGFTFFCFYDIGLKH